jgi:N-acetylmuramic acid 6-phosphate etherase
MIRLGRVYQGLMVDLQAVNKKLVHRSENILSQLTGRGRKEVRDALLQAEGSIKLALLLLGQGERHSRSQRPSAAGGKGVG